MHATLPYHLYVWVNNKSLGKDMPNGMTQGILHGVYGRTGQMLLTHVLLETGAHWSGLPLHQLYHKKIEKELPSLQPWGCMGKEPVSVLMPYLEGVTGTTLKDSLSFRHTGIVIDWNDGFSRYPQEHKPLSLIALEQGNFGLLPNNYFRVYDKHFTNELENVDVSLKKYMRGQEVYWEE
jgi:hypothetical protein